MKKSPWAIRDISHGKTFHFDSYEEMVAWVIRGQIQINNQIVEEIVSKSNVHKIK